MRDGGMEIVTIQVVPFSGASFHSGGVHVHQLCFEEIVHPKIKNLYSQSSCYRQLRLYDLPLKKTRAVKRLITIIRIQNKYSESSIINLMNILVRYTN